MKVPPRGVVGPNGVLGREIDAGWAGGEAPAPGKDLEIGPTVWPGVADSDKRAAGGR
ncbi:hypothetical protein FOMA001_g17582 [Fusarium oxysporum f. sp. matthiolae]|nr:hypothetical protein FOMA001_g17582 [Fusarium oxysporum f. sp. matthiolae]